MVMLSSSTSMIALVALAGAPANAEDLGRWLEAVAQPMIATAASRGQAPVQMGSHLTRSDDWSAVRPMEDLRVRSFVLDQGSIVTAAPNGWQASWNLAPALLELQTYFDMGDDWDGEGAPAPDVGSLSYAIRFLDRLGSDAANWDASLHADGRAVLELQADDLTAELVFNPDGSISHWVERSGEAASGQSDLQSALSIFA